MSETRAQRVGAGANTRRDAVFRVARDLLSRATMRTSVTILALTLLLTAGTAADDKVFFMELPEEVLPYDVGANAFSVVGGFFGERGPALYWLPTTGTQAIGGYAAVAISRDGRTIVGRARDAGGFENAAIWTGGRNWRLLGSFPNAVPCDIFLSSAYGMSADGRVIVGLGWNGCRIAHAFRWEESSGMVDLGTSISGESTRANSISGDGQVIIGWQEDVTGFRMAAKWVALRQELIRGPQPLLGEAHGINHDGSLIVGGNCEPFTPAVPSAWTWKASEGVRCFRVTRPPTLPNLPYSALMLSTNDNGRVIGGAYSFGLDSESLLWLDGQGHFLKDYLRANGYPDAFRGWVNTGFITSVSPDGRTLVGYGAAQRTFRGFLVVLPEEITK